MTKDQINYLKLQINENDPLFLQADKSHKGYVCPACGNGSGSNGDGLRRTPNAGRWKCFSCDRSFDVISLYCELNQLDNQRDFMQALEELANYYSINTNEPVKGKAYTQLKHSNNIKDMEQKKEDYSGLYSEWNKAINVAGNQGLLYLQARNISIATINRFSIGYCETWRHPKAPAGVPASPRIIIPIGKHNYLARDIRPAGELNTEEKKHIKMKVGSEAPAFNIESLSNSKEPVFVVEGEIDAMSIAQVGGFAVGIGGTSGTDSFIRAVKENNFSNPVILCLDNDEAGNRASKKLKNELVELDKDVFEINICEGVKDANEALIKDEGKLYERVAEIRANPAGVLYKMQNCVTSHLQEFLNGINESVNTPAISTGFKNLDRLLDGGLYEGLYTIGAISSLGKTTLVQQVADQIAQQGTDVIFVSLEMARSELMAKSISRLTLQIVNAGYMNSTAKDAKTVRGITDGRRYENYSTREKKLIKKAIEEYSTYSDRLYILEGNANTNIRTIKRAVANHIQATGNKPVLIVDYLQIIRRDETLRTALSDKQLVDVNVNELKQLSRDYKIPVIGISSLNRQSYNESISMSAFKESGAIEYSSDVLIGLQLKGVGSNSFDVDEAKAKSPREVELKILKNRNGITGKTIEFEYTPIFNSFAEAGKRVGKKERIY